MDRHYRKRMSAYWARAVAKGCRQIDRLDFSSWFDYWHTHIDWYGRGNDRPENRSDVAKATISLLKYLEQRAQATTYAPIQIWATLCPNTIDNAVYAHSVNPNGTPYPHDFHGVQRDASVPEWLSAEVIDDSYDIGLISDDGEITCFIRPRG